MRLFTGKKIRISSSWFSTGKDVPRRRNNSVPHWRMHLRKEQSYTYAHLISDQAHTIYKFCDSILEICVSTNIRRILPSKLFHNKTINKWRPGARNILHTSNATPGNPGAFALAIATALPFLTLPVKLVKPILESCITASTPSGARWTVWRTPSGKSAASKAFWKRSAVSYTSVRLVNSDNVGRAMSTNGCLRRWLENDRITSDDCRQHRVNRRQIRITIICE